MSACRGLDVMMGSGTQGAARALPAAAVVTAHIGVVTTVSRQETSGGDASVAQRALAATVAVAAGAALVSKRRGVALGLIGAYAATVGRAHVDAIRDPSPARLQKAVGAGIMGLIPLEAGLLAGAGSFAPAAGVAALWPLARRAAQAEGGHMSLRFGYVSNGLSDHRLEHALQLLSENGYAGVALTLDHIHFDPLAPRLRARASRLRVGTRGTRPFLRSGDRRAVHPRPAPQALPDAGQRRAPEAGRPAAHRGRRGLRARRAGRLDVVGLGRARRGSRARLGPAGRRLRSG